MLRMTPCLLFLISSKGLKSPELMEHTVVPLLLRLVSTGAAEDADAIARQGALRAALSLEAVQRHPAFFTLPRDLLAAVREANDKLRRALGSDTIAVTPDPAPWASATAPVPVGLQDGRAAVLAQAVAGARQATPGVTRLGDGLYASVVHVEGENGGLSTIAAGIMISARCVRASA